MARLRTNFKSLDKWSKYMKTLADRKLDYGKAVSVTETSSHDKVLSVIHNLQDAIYSMKNHERSAAKDMLLKQFLAGTDNDPKKIRAAVKNAHDANHVNDDSSSKTTPSSSNSADDSDNKTNIASMNQKLNND